MRVWRIRLTALLGVRDHARHPRPQTCPHLACAARFWTRTCRRVA